MTEDSSTLDDLYVDKDEINRERIAESLGGIIGIDKESGDMIPLSDFKEISKKQKFVAFLLYRRAVIALGELEEEDRSAKSELIAEKIGAGGSTVRKYAGELDFVKKDKKHGGYYIPEHRIGEACDFMSLTN